MSDKFKAGDRFIHNGELIATIAEVCDTFYKISNAEYTFKCSFPCKIKTFDKTQEYQMHKLSPVPKFKVGDLVLFDDMLGVVTEVCANETSMIHLYRIGKHFPLIEEYHLYKADWRDKVRIFKGKSNIK